MPACCMCRVLAPRPCRSSSCTQQPKCLHHLSQLGVAPKETNLPPKKGASLNTSARGSRLRPSDMNIRVVCPDTVESMGCPLTMPHPASNSLHYSAVLGGWILAAYISTCKLPFQGKASPWCKNNRDLQLQTGMWSPLAAGWLPRISRSHCRCCLVPLFSAYVFRKLLSVVHARLLA